MYVGADAVATDTPLRPSVWYFVAATYDADTGAVRVDLKGKTVMPALVDTHTHLSRDRANLTADLKHRAYFGVGAAMTGMRPVVDIMFGDFMTLTMDQLVNQAAKIHYMSGGKLKVPLVLRTTLGATRRSAASQ